MNRIERLKKEISEISGPNTGEDFARMLPGKVAAGGVFSSGDDAERFAVDVLTRRAYDDARGIAADVLNAVLSGEVDADDVSDRIHESVDSAIIYTKDQFLYAWLLRDADDDSLSDSAEGFDGKLTARAYENLSAAVSDMVSSALDSADWSTEDDEDAGEVA